jgi:hypothetical protein
MSLSARQYYHYTALHHAEEIIAAGGISKGGIPIPDPSGEYLDDPRGGPCLRLPLAAARGWQWLTKRADWAQPWATRQIIDCDRTEVRFVVEIPLLELDRLRRWDDVAADFGYTPEIGRRFAALAGGDSSSWFVFGGVIPKRWILAVEKRPGLGEGVTPCTKM